MTYDERKQMRSEWVIRKKAIQNLTKCIEANRLDYGVATLFEIGLMFIGYDRDQADCFVDALMNGDAYSIGTQEDNDCVNATIDLIRDAINQNFLPAFTDDSKHAACWSVRFRDLKEWLVKYHPSIKPVTIFPEFGTKTEYEKLQSQLANSSILSNELLQQNKRLAQQSEELLLIAEQLNTRIEELEEQLKAATKESAENKGVSTKTINTQNGVIAAMALYIQGNNPQGFSEGKSVRAGAEQIIDKLNSIAERHNISKKVISPSALESYIKAGLEKIKE